MQRSLKGKKNDQKGIKANNQSVPQQLYSLILNSFSLHQIFIVDNMRDSTQDYSYQFYYYRMLTSFLQSTFLSPFEKRLIDKPPSPPIQSSSSTGAAYEANSVHLLPNDIAGRILDLQMQCEEQSSSRDLLGELIGLYTRAIEYYQSLNSPKYHLYKKRLQTYLGKPSIQNKLKGGSDDQLIAKRQMVERSKLHAIISSNEEANRIIERSQQKMDSTNKIVESQVVSQHKKLEARIERRKSLNTKGSAPDERDRMSLLEKKQSFTTVLHDLDRKNKKVLI